jgi:methionyl-tRNA formyltransferase
MNIIFFGSSDFVEIVLKDLHKEHNVISVVTTPDAPAGRKGQLSPTPIAELATKLELALLKPASLKTTEAEHQLKALNPDLFVVASYGKIIPQNILDIPKFGCLNIHPSLLPKYRGSTPIQTALKNGDTETGISIIVMDAEVDHGPILVQEKFSIDRNEHFQSLANKLFYIGSQLLLDNLKKYTDKTIIPLEQDHTSATFTKMLNKEDGKVNWTKSASEIYNQYRALIEWPGIWTTWKDQQLKIISCEPINVTGQGSPGDISLGGLVTCGKESIQLKSIQLPGKQPMEIKEFLNGHKDFIGSALN